MAWRINTLTNLHWRCWDDEWVAFDVGSGQTHQMDTLTAVTLMVMDAQQIELPTVLVRVAEELQLVDSPELLTALTGILEKLVAAGLIESVPA